MDLTEIKDGIIPVDFAGKNGIYRRDVITLSSAYPRVPDFSYNDDYYRAMNEQYSIGDTLGEKRLSVANGNMADIARIMWSSSSIKNLEAEDVLIKILMDSAKINSWAPFVVNVMELNEFPYKTANEYLQNCGVITTRADCNPSDVRVAQGIFAASIGGYAIAFAAKPFGIDEKVIVLATPKFAQYCKSRV